MSIKPKEKSFPWWVYTRLPRCEDFLSLTGDVAEHVGPRIKSLSASVRKFSMTRLVFFTFTFN